MVLKNMLLNLAVGPPRWKLPDSSPMAFSKLLTSNPLKHEHEVSNNAMVCYRN